MLDYTKLSKSLSHLQVQESNYQKQKGNPEIEKLMLEALQESVIQRFEVCYDNLWKLLKKYLEEELGLPNVPNSPKPVFRLMNENGYLNEIEKWLDYSQARIDTTHGYNEEKMRSALKIVGNFINDAIDLFEILTGTKWKNQE